MSAQKLYASHVPLAPLSRMLLGIGSAVTAISDPKRGDMVAAMGETTAIGPVLENIRKRMESDVVGKRLLLEKPRISNGTIDRKWLRQLPDGTLGKLYSNFLDRLNTSPDARPTVKYIDNLEHLYVMQRYRETHDFTHIALEQKTNMLGEVTVKYFEGIQYGLPMCVTGGIFGGARLLTKNRQELVDRNLPWVVEQATNARFFMAFDWENHFEKQLSEVQKELNITPLSVNM
ncbi:Ubiquinone biosynthesis protein coq-4, mitochondrial [Caenorhabditis elegans]|uniref:Ubiquinone biosynthesis protein coq-4, mitochondrial n=1 Tax=Caenorhabditis elegans TaxID=6239 RepID=COQ4_CAEEL|nr:Ubiquinone biosynthesis protein coq-4, mitochondrial [Caenorhabditis elegans]P91428.2 RecName: Full=Ubiquinone biosynthesis protein coq-4, mitochondrial; AltName: Full=Coenzyme Q biosynthesis protein 4 [Caenorhabditis elegans]CCD67787.1 Ubiquinone biosynthesis protein coq-4, mitochondrial [Caenorhabditis elegans]|eukprot:NP_491246.4 Ubiquinone biosynthesis protein coq-4, mitochondrial [Caenorhabditis elegans]